MKKLGLASLFLAVSLFAADANKNKTTTFVGFGTFSGTGTQTKTLSDSFGNSISAEIDYDATATPISFGFIGPTNNRLEFTLYKIDVDAQSGGTATFSTYGLNYDITLESLRAGNLLPYVGLGFDIYNYDDTGHLYVDGEDLKGVAFNLNLGLLYEVSKNIELEVAYQNRQVTWAETEILGSSFKLEIEEDISGLYLGLNLKF